MQKRVAGNIIKPIEFETFGAEIENGLGNHQKSLPREGFRNAFSKSSGNLIKLMKILYFKMSFRKKYRKLRINRLKILLSILLRCKDIQMKRRVIRLRSISLCRILVQNYKNILRIMGGFKASINNYLLITNVVYNY